MSAALSKLMDREKYLLAGMVYFHLPVELATRDFEAQPLPLREQIELIEWCESGSANAKGADGTDIDSMRASREQYLRLYEAHAGLHDLKLIAYVNDNAGAYATTDGARRTGFVAMAYADDDGNRVAVFSGCETHKLRPMVKDYLDCFAAAAGANTPQHRMALAFYDRVMRGATGERGIIGHSKGGNLSTHVYVNRLSDKPQVYCINAQPYCWWAMTREQQAALKSDRYEFIAHAGDVVHHAGYVSYVSRIVQMNPYINRSQLLSLHDFSSMEFDSLGNLQGSRVLRATRRTLKSRLFGDVSGEDAPNHDAVVERFRALLKQRTEPDRLLSIALEETGLATHADTVLLLMRLPRDSGDILYTYQARGESDLRLRDFSMRVPRGDALAALLQQGMPVNVSDTSRFEAHFQPLENVLGWKVRAANVIPLGGEGTPWLGSLELLSRERPLSAEDMALAVELGDGLAQLIRAMPTRALNRPNNDPLLLLKRGDEALLELERHAYRTITYDYSGERDAYLRLFDKGRLASDLTLRFDGWGFSPDDIGKLRNWRRSGVVLVSREPCRDLSARSSRKPAATMPAQEAARLMGFAAISKAALESLARPDANPLPRGEAEADAIRARIALCLTRRPPLIVFDTWGCADETVGEASAYLHLLCYDKLASVLVLRRAKA